MNQNLFSFDGTVYMSVPIPDQTLSAEPAEACAICDFQEDKCNYLKFVGGIPNCTPQFREDRKNVVFKKVLVFQASQIKGYLNLAEEPTLDQGTPGPADVPAAPTITSDGSTTVTSDGSSADYYVLPEGATQLQDLISARDMNAQDGEMFRALYRKGRCSHSSRLREAKKVLFYAQAEVDRLEKYV